MVYFGFLSLSRMGLRKVRQEVEDTRHYSSPGKGKGQQERE